LVIAFPASELLLSHRSIIASTHHSSSTAMPTFARRKENIHDLFTSKKRKLSAEQNFQRILAQEAATSANENRVNNKFPPHEPMVESRDANERMSERDNHNDGRGAADDPISDSGASFVLARDDSMSSEDDDDQNDFIFDDIFGLEAKDDGTTDDGQPLKTTSASRHGANVDGNPQVMMYPDEEENHQQLRMTLNSPTLRWLNLNSSCCATHRAPVADSFMTS
jgi:hypothetical protein